MLMDRSLSWRLGTPRTVRGKPLSVTSEDRTPTEDANKAGTELVYTFGVYSLYPERRLLAAEKQILIGGRAFDILVALLERAEEFVGKDELLAKAWPGIHVEEGNLPAVGTIGESWR